MNLNAVELFGVFIFAIFLLVFGIIAIAAPLAIIKLVMKWPKFLFLILHQGDNLPPRIEYAFHLLDEDTEAYAKEFSAQLISLRIGGLIALLTLCVLIMILTQPQ